MSCFLANIIIERQAVFAVQMQQAVYAQQMQPGWILPCDFRSWEVFRPPWRNCQEGNAGLLGDGCNLRSGEIERAWTAGTGAFHDMQVDHGGLDAGVPHQGLDGADVGSGFEEMSGEAVAHGVAGGPFGDGFHDAQAGAIHPGKENDSGEFGPY